MIENEVETGTGTTIAIAIVTVIAVVKEITALIELVVPSKVRSEKTLCHMKSQS